jgi:hypothetical protein
VVVRNGSEFEDEIERRWWVGLTKETQGLKSFAVSASFLERFQRAGQYLDDLGYTSCNLVPCPTSILEVL